MRHEQTQTFCYCSWIRLKWLDYIDIDYKRADNSPDRGQNPHNTLTMSVLRVSVARLWSSYTVMAEVFPFLLPNRHEHWSCAICHFLIRENRSGQAIYDQLTRKAAWEMNARFAVFLLTSSAIAQLLRSIECAEDFSERQGTTIDCIKTGNNTRRKSIIVGLIWVGFMSDGNE